MCGGWGEEDSSRKEFGQQAYKHLFHFSFLRGITEATTRIKEETHASEPDKNECHVFLSYLIVK